MCVCVCVNSRCTQATASDARTCLLCDRPPVQGPHPHWVHAKGAWATGRPLGVDMPIVHNAGPAGERGSSVEGVYAVCTLEYGLDLDVNG